MNDGRTPVKLIRTMVNGQSTLTHATFVILLPNPTPNIDNIHLDDGFVEPPSDLQHAYPLEVVKRHAVFDFPADATDNFPDVANLKAILFKCALGAPVPIDEFRKAYAQKEARFRAGGRLVVTVKNNPKTDPTPTTIEIPIGDADEIDA